MVGPQLGCAAVSGVRAQHLQRRSGIFHLRVRVPDDIRSLVGLTELRRSLRTYQPARARVLAAVYAARVFEVFNVIRTKELSKDQVRGLICNLFEQMKREVEGTASGRFTDWERNEQLYCSSEIAVAVGEQRALGAYEREVQITAERALRPLAVRLSELAPSSKDDLLDGAARALVERERMYQLRLNDRLVSFAPKDPLFTGLPEHLVAPVAIDLGPTLGEAIDTYLAAKKKSWTQKTYTIRVRYLGYLRQHFGDDRSLASIKAADVREFRDAIARLRKNNGKAVRQTFLQKQTDNLDHRIGDSTVALIFVPTQAFFRWCVSDQGYLDTNPAGNIRVAIAKSAKGKRSRRPFTAKELQRLFVAPVFTGCASAKRRFMSGSCKVQDAYYWVPILGFYTGARLGELVQLHLADVTCEDGVALLRIPALSMPQARVRIRCSPAMAIPASSGIVRAGRLAGLEYLDASWNVPPSIWRRVSEIVSAQNSGMFLHGMPTTEDLLGGWIEGSSLAMASCIAREFGVSAACYPVLQVNHLLSDLPSPDQWEEYEHRLLDTRVLFIPDLSVDCGTWGDSAFVKWWKIEALLRYRYEFGLPTFVGVQTPQKLPPSLREIVLGAYEGALMPRTLPHACSDLAYAHASHGLPMDSIDLRTIAANPLISRLALHDGLLGT